jgi:hypothetical protein
MADEIGAGSGNTLGAGSGNIFGANSTLRAEIGAGSGNVIGDGSGNTLEAGLAAVSTVVPGETVALSVAWVPGQATGASEVLLPPPSFGGSGYRGPVLPAPRSAKAPGDTVVCIASLRAGAAQTISLLPGNVGAGARAGGSIVQFSPKLRSGLVSAERNLTDEDLLILFAEAA